MRIIDLRKIPCIIHHLKTQISGRQIHLETPAPLILNHHNRTELLLLTLGLHNTRLKIIKILQIILSQLDLPLDKLVALRTPSEPPLQPLFALDYLPHVDQTDSVEHLHVAVRVHL